MRRILLAIAATALTGAAHADEMQEYLEKFGIDKNAPSAARVTWKPRKAKSTPSFARTAKKCAWK